MLALFVKVSTMYSRNFSSTKDPQSIRGAAIFYRSHFYFALPHMFAGEVTEVIQKRQELRAEQLCTHSVQSSGR